MPVLILSVLIQLSLVVHIVRSGRDKGWIFIVLIFPIVGSLAYLILEVLPEHSVRDRGTRRADPFAAAPRPGGDSVAEQNVERCRQQGEESLSKGRFAEASHHFLCGLRGDSADDPQLLLGLANAQLGCHEFLLSIETLDRLRKRNPGIQSTAAHLLYARAREGAGQLAAARSEYVALCGYCAEPEPHCRLGLLLKARGESAAARAQFARVLDAESTVTDPAQREWIALARRESAA